MRGAVASLPEEQQLLIGLFYGQQMGYAEIARVTGLRRGHGQKPAEPRQGGA